MENLVSPAGVDDDTNLGAEEEQNEHAVAQN
jgi:hypothetical protein